MKQRLISRVTTAPAATPILLADLRKHLRIDGATDENEDAVLTAYIAAAVQFVEDYCGISLITQTRDTKFDYFENLIELPRPPLASVSYIKYLDADGAQQTLADTVYQVDTFSRPGIIRLGVNQSWPAVYDQAQAIEIRYLTGFGNSGSYVPETIKHALKLLCGHWYENRTPVNIGNIVNSLPFAVEPLLAPYRVWSFT